MERTEVKPVARNPKSPTTSEDSDHFSFPEHGKKYAPRVFIFANRFLKCSSQTIKLMIHAPPRDTETPVRLIITCSLGESTYFMALKE